MKKLKNTKLVKMVLILIVILLSIIIIKECKLLGFCYTIITLISPLFFGYAIAWLIKPVMLKFNKSFSTMVSTAITYALLALILGLIGYFAIPIIIKEFKGLINLFIKLYENLDPKIINNMDLSALGTKALTWFNKFTTNLKDIVLNIFYSIFISYFFLLNHQDMSRFIAKKVPSDLIKELSQDLRSYVKGTLLDTIILLVASLVIFYFIKLPYALLFAILISITNIIPYIGPYIGGVPSILVAFGVNNTLGFTVLGVVVFLQVIESSFIHPYIMSKAIKVNQILIMISLIVCGYFFGVFGMLLSTPIICVIKTLYIYNKEHKFIDFQVLGK